VGAKLKEIAYAARGANLGGLEWMEGIPGAVGGGLRMNAGAMGAQTFENVVSIRYLDSEGNAHDKKRDELEVRYRHFPLLEKNFAVSATFRATASNREQIETKLQESQEKRRATAGKLVDELGLKNSSIGKARVSEVHGNFIVNDGGATAADMLELINRIKKTAKSKRGIELETEVQIVGEEG
jgi:UDP-N-acetylmuramate--alanine ligase